MNNNNHFNTNNWVGTTHLDFFKNSSNALSNYTYNTSNILENDILINSNINYLYTSNSSNSNISFTSNTSNIILNRYDKLIKEETENITFPISATLKHTYIYNNNNAGEIRFQNKAYITDVLGFPTGTPNYKAKIDIDGKLKSYWVYDPLVSLTYLGGWHEPISEIAGLIADSINQGGLITALEGQIVINKKYTDTELTLIWAYIEGVQAGIITPGQTTITPAENARDMLSWGTPEVPPTPSTPGVPASPVQNANAIFTFNQRVQQLASAREVIRNSTIVRISDALLQYVLQNPLTSFVLGTGFTTAGIAYAILQGIEYNRYYSGVIENVIDQNSNLSSGIRLSLHNINQSNIIASNLIDYCSNTYLFGINQGFVNSNVVAQQYINDLKVSSLNLNNGNLTNFNTINGNTGIFNTISTTNNTDEAIPSTNSFGGIGDKIIIKTGTSITYPYSIGIENKALWISGEDNINFYNRGIKSLSLTSNNSTQIFGELLCNSNLKLNQTNISNIFVASNVLSNINLNQGFLNSNTIAQQYLNSINTNEIKINQTNISNIFVASNVLSNINLNQGFINSNITNQQYISNLKTDNLILNNGNISNINGISTNELIASGKIKQNGILLDNIYLTSNHLYNLAFNYTAERQYPSKLFTSSSIEGTATLLNKLVYKQILFLDTTSISYGSGFYEVYSSSTFDNGITNKDKLFNFNTTETTTSPRWAINLYNSGTGNYQADNSIDGAYFGDWIIIKLPQEILLTRYRIYQRTDFLTKAPAEWKCYGSKDGITFNEITEGHQLTRLTSYSSGFYEKSLASTFTTQYQYIGFCFNKLLSTSGQSDLSFAELQIFGKEIISNSIVSNIYTTSNAVKNIVEFQMPLVSKHYAFYINITTPIIINTKTYYKYDVDLRQYTKLGYIDIGSQSGDSYRIFKLRACYGSMYFSTLVNGLPNVIYSDIFMSMKANPTANLGVAGLNICSIGNINNPKLDIVPSNNLFFMRNGANSIDYITIVSTNVADVRCFIEDMIS